MIAGVCAGIGNYLDVDPNLIRIVWAVLSLGSLGTGMLLYLIVWLLMPEDDGPSGPIDAEYTVKEE
jgi:phage shock protein C